MNTAMMMMLKEPCVAEDIFVYHSGESRYTAAMDNNIGNPNSMAIGSPLNSLLEKLLCMSRFFFQYSIKASSFSDNMVRK